MGSLKEQTEKNIMDIESTYETDYRNFTTMLIFIITFLVVYLNTRRQKGVPPGPALFPVIGNLPSLASANTLGKLKELRKQYGDVFGLYTGRKFCVFLNGYDVIHDALIKNGSIFMSRASPGFDKEGAMHTKGLIFSRGQIWKEGRKFAIATLQEICYSDKGFIEHLVDYEVNNLTETVIKFNKPFDIEPYLNSSVQNIIFQIVYGHRFDLNDEGLHWLQRTIRTDANEFMIREIILNCLPFLQHLPGDILRIEKAMVSFLNQMNFLTKLIDKFKNEKNETHKQTFVQCYLDKMAANSSSGNESTFDEMDMKVAAFHLIVGGSQTSATTIRWILLYLIRNPDIQDKLHAELTNVLGNDQPSVGDKKRLPYTQAVLLEGLRVSLTVPLTLPLAVEHDTVFRGYLIPKHCTVIAVLSTALQDPAVWEDPEEFKPERFLNAEGNDVIVPKQFIPFSLGRRSCLGETLATTEIFLFLAGLVQKSKFLPENNTYPDKNGHLGITFTPENFRMRIVKR